MTDLVIERAVEMAAQAYLCASPEEFGNLDPLTQQFVKDQTRAAIVAFLRELHRGAMTTGFTLELRKLADLVERGGKPNG